MNTKYISFQDIDAIPQLIKDFLSGTLEGYGDDVWNEKNIDHKLIAKQTSFSQGKRRVLVDELFHQYDGFALTEKQLQHLELLRNTSTFTVTTGHQLNLFSGPVFFIYKILQTIKTSMYLGERHPEYTFVPIFWMATEDHDFEEINHFRTYSNYYNIDENAGGPVGRIAISDTDFITKFEKEFKDDVFGNELITILKECYVVGETMTSAIRKFAQHLFSEYGLICLDGDSSRLKEEVVPIFLSELKYQDLNQQSRQKVEFLRDKYGKVQVNPREINLFYLSDTRNRIVSEDKLFKVLDTDITFTSEEIEREINEFPDRFSPNALMRPVYQETVLPNIAYIGGNAEIMYWLELKDYFRAINLQFPLLIPRNSMLMVTEKTMRKISKLGLSAQDFFKDIEDLITKQLLEGHPIEQELHKRKELLLESFEALEGAAKLTDITFKNMVAAEKTRQLKSFERLEKRLLRAEKIKQQEKVEHLRRLYNEFHSGSIWQERVINFSSFYALHGGNWLKNCFNSIDPTKSQMVVAIL